MKRKQAVQRKYRKMLTTDPNAASGSYKVPIREDEGDSGEEGNQNREYKPQPRLVSLTFQWFYFIIANFLF
jgi:hypothetical protein